MSKAFEPLEACHGIAFGASRDEVLTALGAPEKTVRGMDCYIDSHGLRIGYRDARHVSSVWVYPLTEVRFEGLDLLRARRCSVLRRVKRLDPGCKVDGTELISQALEVRLWTRDVENHFDLFECGPRGYLENRGLESAEALRTRLYRQVCEREDWNLDESYAPLVDDVAFLGFLPSDALRTAFLTETSVGNTTAAWLATCQNLEELFLRDTQVSEQGARLIAGLPRLRRLSFAHLKLSGEFLADLPLSLDDLTLVGAQLAPAHWRSLDRLSGLRRLFLRNANLSDDHLDVLAGLSNLVNLDVNGTAVSKAGVECLQESLPNCSITWFPVSELVGHKERSA